MCEAGWDTLRCLRNTWAKPERPHPEAGWEGPEPFPGKDGAEALRLPSWACHPRSPQKPPALAPAQPLWTHTLTCFIRSKSKASRATSLTLPAGFILGRGRRGVVGWALGGLSSRGKWAPQHLPAAGLALPSSNAAALAPQKGLSRPVSTLRGPPGYRDHISQPKRQDLGSPDWTVLTRKHPCMWMAF